MKIKKDSSFINRILAELWWLEYQDASRDAREALRNGDKLRALALAIMARKVLNKYEYYAGL